MFKKILSTVLSRENIAGKALSVLTAFVFIAGLLVYLPAAKSTSNTVGNRELPIYCVDTKEKKVALSFDAAWGNDDTRNILDILSRYNVHVTFFMTGGWVEKYPDDVKAIAAAGHDLGNHSEHHYEMSKLSVSQIKDELLSVHNKVKELTGCEMCLFRPPYGDYNNALVTTSKECNYYTIQWSVDSLDWKDYGVQKIADTVLNHKALDNGAIILMHNGAKYTPEALPQIIEGLQNKGYEIVPISALILKDNYHLDNTGKQIAN
ncbi:MAG: polysaccharide deacetylase family protein [Lachnospiraceae bacterium]|nr:polysaccharide deacetylase family protein [Lachnospiraceae bacterium]